MKDTRENKNISGIERAAHHKTNMDRTQYLRLDMNENIDSLPTEFIQSVFSSISGDMLATYPNQEKTTQILADYNRLEYQNILLTNGSDGAINWVFETFIAASDKVLLTNPTFAMYNVYGKIYDADVLTVNYESNLEFPYEEFMDRLNQDIKLAVVVNPNNPCGTVLEEEKLVSIIEKAHSNNTLLVVDEAYYYFYTETVKDYVKKYDNLIVLRTFSKVCAMAGLRVGYIMADSKIIYSIKKVALSFDVNAVGLVFVNKLMENQYIIDDLCKNVNDGKKFVCNELDQLNIPYVLGKGCFMLIELHGDLHEIQQYFKEKGILVSLALNKYIRINLGAPGKMQLFINELKKGKFV